MPRPPSTSCGRSPHGTRPSPRCTTPCWSGRRDQREGPRRTGASCLGGIGGARVDDRPARRAGTDADGRGCGGAGPRGDGPARARRPRHVARDVRRCGKADPRARRPRHAAHGRTAAPGPGAIRSRGPRARPAGSRRNAGGGAPPARPGHARGRIVGFAYDEALAARGDRAGRVEWWRSQGLRTDLPSTERRAAAFRLIELRDKPGAEQVLRAIVERDPADAAALAQLLHLWGPRPPRPALDWLEARARAAKGPDQAAWLRHLTDLGGARRTCAILDPPPAPDEAARFDAWVDALRATRDRDGRSARSSAASPPRATRSGSTPSHARPSPNRCRAPPSGHSRRSWQSIPRRSTRDAGWACSALARNDTVAAREHLEAYVAAGGRDPRPCCGKANCWSETSAPTRKYWNS